MQNTERRPQIKFYKDAISDILSDRKTIEPRPRSRAWIERIAATKLVDLTYGPRISVPKIFATAKILKVETRPFNTATEEDLKGIALGWQDKAPEEFIVEYEKWFQKELSKGYPVAWIYFKVIDKHE